MNNSTGKSKTESKEKVMFETVEASTVVDDVKNIDSSHLVRGYFIGNFIQNYAREQASDGFRSGDLREELEKYGFEVPHANSLLFLMQGMEDMGILKLDGRTWYSGTLDRPELTLDGDLERPINQDDDE